MWFNYAGFFSFNIENAKGNGSKLTEVNLRLFSVLSSLTHGARVLVFGRSFWLHNAIQVEALSDMR